MTLHPVNCQMPISMPVPVERHFDSGYTFGKRRDSLLTKFDLLFEDSLKEWMSFKPAIGLAVYPCYACRHMFSTKSALQDHVNRRVLVFQYTCTNCSEIQPCVFYNRCALLLHLRTHFDFDRGEIDLDALVTGFLPISLAGFLPHPDIPRLYDAPESNDRVDSYINTQFYTPDLTERGKQVVILKANSLTFEESGGQSITLMQVSLEVPKCEFITLEHHLKLKQAYSANRHNEEWQNQQRLQLQSLVSRVNGAAPVDIKEEPQDDDNSSSDYHQNMTLPVIAKVESLQENNNTVILPKCLECNLYQECAMAEHYLGDNRPADMNLRCLTCKFIASTECSLKAHIRIHSEIPPHVCPDCGRHFENPETLREHMSEVCFHLAKLVRYRCPGKKCGKLFANNNTFGIHLKNHLIQSLTCCVCNAILHSNIEAEEHKLRHPEEERQNCVFRRKHHCLICPDDIITDKNYTEHINMHTSEMDRCIYVYMCKLCRSSFRSTTTFASHSLRCNGRGPSGGNSAKNKKSGFFTKDCEGCDTKIIYSNEKPLRFCNGCKMTKLLKPPSIESEPEPEKSQVPEKPQKLVHKRYYCVLCKNKITIEEKVTHMRRCGYAHPLVLIKKLTHREIQKYTVSGGVKDELASPPPKRRSDPKSPNKDENRRSRKRPSRPRPKPDLEPDLTAGEPMTFDGTYYCKLCDFKNENREEFHQHIKDHRDVSTAYQCMECGECFVVKPSLMKHLMHFHNVADCEAYLEANDCYDVEAVKELQETVRLGPLAVADSEEPLKENQCRVCREEFEDSASLNKHFRIHGMAFLLKNSK